MAVVTRVVVMVMMKPQLATGGQAKILNFVEPCDSDDDDDDDNDNGDNGDRDSDGDDVGGGDGGNVNDDDDGGGGDDDDNGDGGGGGDDDHDHDHDGGGGGGGDDDDGTSDSHVRYVQVCDNTRYSTYTLGTNIFLANLLHLPALRHGDADAVSVKPHLTQVTTDHEPAESDRPTINTPTTHILQEWTQLSWSTLQQHISYRNEHWPLHTRKKWCTKIRHFWFRNHLNNITVTLIETLLALNTMYKGKPRGRTMTWRILQAEDYT